LCSALTRHMLFSSPTAASPNEVRITPGAGG
jgi:hypothetical protein